MDVKQNIELRDWAMKIRGGEIERRRKEKLIKTGSLKFFVRESFSHPEVWSERLRGIVDKIA